MCPNCRAFVSTSDRVCPYCEITLLNRQPDRSPSSSSDSGFIPQVRFVTMIILIINFGLYMAMVLASDSPESALVGFDGRTILTFGGNYPGGAWWRLIVAGFLHGGILHILFNSWVLFDLGADVDEAFGTARMLVIYIGSTVTGFLLSARAGHFSVGSSAAIYGLIGAMIALGTRSRSSYGDMIKALYIRWLIYGLIMNFFPGVDWAAHIGGFAGGFAIGFLSGPPEDSRGAEPLWRACAAMCGIVTAYAFYYAYRSIASNGGMF